MDKKAYFEHIKKDAVNALTKVFDKVEEVTKVSGIKLKINNLYAKIKGIKFEIGEYTYKNPDKFKDIPEIAEMLDRINKIENEIELKREQIAELKEKEEEEEKNSDDNPHDFSL